MISLFEDFDQSHTDNVVKGNLATTEKRRRGRRGNAYRAKPCILELDEGRRQITGFVTEMVNDAGGMTLNQTVDRPAIGGGPNHFHGGLMIVKAQREVHILDRVKNRLANPVTERRQQGRSGSRLLHRQTKMMKN